MEDQDQRNIPAPENVLGGIKPEMENPLLSEQTISHVLGFMESTINLQDLGTIRSVCKLWNEVSLPLWRKLTSLRIGPGEKMVKTRRHTALAPLKYVPVNQFLEMVTRSPRDPFQIETEPLTNLVLYGVDFKDSFLSKCLAFPSNPSGGNETSNLWTYLFGLGDTLQSFGFKNCKFFKDDDDLEGVRLFEKLLTTKLTFVPRLTIVNYQSHPEYYFIQSGQENRHRKAGYQSRNPNLKSVSISGQLPMHLFLLLMDCPNLEEFTLQNNYELFSLLELFSVLDYRRLHFPEEKPFPLKKLDVLESRFFYVNGYLNEGFPPYFEHLHLPLEYLSLTLPNYSNLLYNTNSTDSTLDIVNIFQPLLQKCHSTLKTLKVLRTPIVNAFSNNHPLFPVELPVLEELHLYGNLVDNFRFLQSTPKLKVLKIDTRCMDFKKHLERLYLSEENRPEERQWFYENFKPFWDDMLFKMLDEFREIRLTNMTSLNLQCRMYVGTVEVLAQWMPNLKVFKAVFESDAVWRMVCKWMPDLEEVGILRGSKVGEEAIIGVYKKYEMPGAKIDVCPYYYNIASLKQLRRFQYYAYCGQSLIGSKAVYSGFLLLEELQSIHLCVSKSFSEDAEDALEDKIEDVTIVRNTNSSCRGGWECCEDRAFLKKFAI